MELLPVPSLNARTVNPWMGEFRTTYPTNHCGFRQLRFSCDRIDPCSTASGLQLLHRRKQIMSTIPGHAVPPSDPEAPEPSDPDDGDNGDDESNA